MEFFFIFTGFFFFFADIIWSHFALLTLDISNVVHIITFNTFSI